MLTIGSLFSGIGGLELGLERAGLGEVLWQCEIDPFCRGVLAKHWPDVKRFADVTVPRAWPDVDLICGGFPCQDVSAAGAGAGLQGARSGLWYAFAKVIDQVRPRFVIVENVTSGKRRWLPAVRRHLHMLGYRTRAFGLSAFDVGAPHLRRRVFIVADTERVLLRVQQGRRRWESREGPPEPGAHGETRPMADTTSARRHVAQDAGASRPNESPTAGAEEWAALEGGGAEPERGGDALGDPVLDGRSRPEGAGHERRPQSPEGGWWASEPNVGRVAHGVSGGMDGRRRRARLRALGNAVVPQCAEALGAMIRAELES